MSYRRPVITPADLPPTDYFNRIGKMLVLRRRKLSGGGTHDGLQLPDGTIVHLTDTGGAQHCSYEAFAQGLPITIVREVNFDLYVRVMNNVRVALSEQRQYHFIDWNCERFVNWLTCEAPDSPQVTGWFFIGLAVAAVVIAARA
jgi:hypothetical protein